MRRLFLFLLLGFLGPTATALNCTKEEFACSFGDQCIPLVKWQDGIDDCVDASDEVCLPWQFDCKFGNPRCISSNKVNDGKIHCYSALDEGCPSHFFVCSDRSACIEPSKFQDGTKDCDDGSDEPCNADDFPCNDGKCVPGEKFQDGVKDCQDGSDEECTATQFECLCGRVRCIHSDRMNDGKRDCEDGSDEGHGKVTITHCADGSPSRTGRNSLLYGQGMTLCSEPNPCPQELGQICIVVGGTWRCVCKLGLVRPIGSTRCLPTELLPAYLANPAANCTDIQNDLQLQIGSLKNSTRNTKPPQLSISPPHSSRPVTHAVSTVTSKPIVQTTKKMSTPRTSHSDILRGFTKETRQQIQIGTTREGYTNHSDDEQSPIVSGNGSDQMHFMFNEDEIYQILKDEGNCDPNGESTCKDENQSCVQNLQGFYYCGCSGNTTLVDGKCVVLTDECELSLHDCDPNALCMDNVDGYECLCREGYLDVSPRPTLKPGRKCHKLINECANATLNDCHPNSKCIDKPSGFTCRCHPEYHDISPEGARKPGRDCQKLIDECLSNQHDCDPSAKCRDLPIGYSCSCPSGYTDTSPDQNKPGRACALLSTDDEASEGSICLLFGNSTKCSCASGYTDIDPQHPGKKCSKSQNHGSNPCQDYSLHDCDPVAECVSEQPGYFQCHCPKGFTDLSSDKRFPGRKCVKAVDECSLGTHTCDPHADCIDTTDSYTCRCRNGWSDASRDPLNHPGRVCKQSQRSQCAHADCAQEAECRESPSGPICQCVSGYVDVSRQHGRPQGRVCRAVVNECVTGQHDCSTHSACIDTADSFTCRCSEGYRDESPDVRQRPGRVCVRALVPDPPECDVADPMSCDQHKQEVCLFMNGTYKCRCAAGYSRLPDGRCLVINECADKRLNDCGANSECIDQADGFTCQCRSGYADVSPAATPGRICKPRVNECANKERYGVDCSENAICVDKEDAYSCQCRPGFADVSAAFNRLPGRKCIEAINECLDEHLNDCSSNAICEDAKEGYTCTCRAGYVDASPDVHYPGRVCSKPVERQQKQEKIETSLQMDGCDPVHPRCRPNEVCIDRRHKGQHTCECADNAFRYDDGSCRLYSACSKKNECDQNAICLNVFDSYKCQCRPGFFDISPDPEGKPGRKCKELINECASSDNTCSPFSRCIDATDGYACQCQEGYVDTSSKYGLPPGRKCANASNECALETLNSCDENADCVDTPDSYTCQCYAGFVDVSSSANLPPGRVCTVQTTCPKQKTDLMFLIDGSGSIGSYVFKNEVLRFVKEFVDLFEIGPDRTRVGLIQYSDQIRHEFDLNQYDDKTSLLRAIGETQYLTGLTRTGAAIQHMVSEGFSERRGARPQSDEVSRVAIVLTDGRSQDNVTQPAIAARNLKVNTFAIGVTDHVLASELESIAGSPHRWFYVDRFKDLDTRLRSMIQKVACPSVQSSEKINTGPCNPRTQTGCDRSLNELCVQEGSTSRCVCPDGFQRHPQTRVCGGSLCNPQLLTSCIFPEECLVTPYNNFRCSCPEGYDRDYRSGFCVSIKEVHISQQSDGDCHNGGVPCGQNEQCVRDRSGSYFCECAPGFERSPHTGKCAYPGSCNPQDPFSCDVRKREHCIHSNGHYTCQCDRTEKRHPVTGVCLKNECLTGENDCDRSARCIDTDDGYICACPSGFIDRSPDSINKPGRLCVAEQNECLDGSNRCSSNAFCTDTENGYICRCKPGFVDYSPNQNSFPGLVCKALVNECANSNLNDCHRDAICIDTQEAYTCICKAGFQDMDEFRNPGRTCKKIQQNERCSPGNNNCDRNARCIQIGDNDFTCSCPPEFKDKSPNLAREPGRVCIPVIPECDNPSLNDCDSPDRAICTDTDESYLCRCRQGFLDISPNIRTKPGRLCKQLQNECQLGTHDCARDGGLCEDTPDSYTCRCAINYLDVSFDRQTRPGRKCKRLVDECVTGQNDCSSEATCTDTEDSYICACPSTHIDLSTDTQHRPGRRCLLRVNECASNRHDCSPNADCMDTPESYSCRCRDDFVDESPDRSQRPGRICRPALVDECRLGKNDCHKDAICQDLPQGFNCQCKAEFLDDSPHRSTHPGRLCRPRPTPPPDECRIDSLRDCREDKGEVCSLVNGIPKCTCPVNYSRDSAGACTVINECSYPQLNDCHTSAECIDQANGFTCRCLGGFKDISPNGKPGRLCKALVNECEYPHLNDCHQNAQCIDLEEGYECKCQQGFKDKSKGRPGRICKHLINECENVNMNSCDKNADCVDEEDGYRCQCRSNFYDVSPSLKGRACRAIVNECRDSKLNDCDRNAKCKDTLDSYECECPANSRDISPTPAFPGRVCLMFENECENGKNDCDQNALCHDNEQSFTCECPTGYADRSPNKLTRPGRVCVRLVNECTEGRHTCSAQADCRDLEEGYTCECKEGYVDRSPNIQLQPGRVCGTPEVCPSNHQCSSAAVCEPLGGNEYKCTCIQGYMDQSPNGATGRICVRNNACRDPKLNNCSKNAICYDEPRGYRCECARGYVDKSPNQSERGRICELPAPPTAPPTWEGPRQVLHHSRIYEPTRTFDDNGNFNFDSERSYETSRTEVINHYVPAPAPAIQIVEKPSTFVSSRDDQVVVPTKTVESVRIDQWNTMNPSVVRSKTFENTDVEINIREKPAPAPSRPSYPTRHLETSRIDFSRNEIPVRHIQMTEPPRIIVHRPSTFDSSRIEPVQTQPTGTVISSNHRENQPPSITESRIEESSNIHVIHHERPSTQPPIIHRIETFEEPRVIQRPSTQHVTHIERINTFEFGPEPPRTEPPRTTSLRPSTFDSSVNEPGRREPTGTVISPGHKINEPPSFSQSRIEESSNIEVIVHEKPSTFPPIFHRPSTQETHIERTIIERPQVIIHRPSTFESSRVEQTLVEPSRVVVSPGHPPMESFPPSMVHSRIEESSNIHVIHHEPPPRKVIEIPSRPSEQHIIHRIHQNFESSGNEVHLAPSHDTSRTIHITNIEQKRVFEAPTPPPRHPCQDPEQNDCHPAGTCRATGAQTYTCECLQGYADRSPNPSTKPGRVCVLTEPICLDPSQNDCHPAAICSETNDADKYTCRCRDGYIDQSPLKAKKPGRICVEQINECLDRSLNDCDPLGVCEDKPEGYTCRCPVGTIDKSADPITRPGRKCFQQVNECRNPSLNNCSRFADCFDKEEGFSCKCKSGYHDDDASHPGTKCSYIINECESANLNDCDRNAECIDTPGGYDCRCRSPFRDEGPRGQPGRVCRLNECVDPKMNNCDKNAECHDTDDGYYCSCRTGFYDNSPNPLEPGRICLAFQEEVTPAKTIRPFEQSEPIPTRRPQTLGQPCGRSECVIERNEVCIGGVRCGCRPGESRSSPTERCQKIEKTPMQIRVTSWDNRALMYSSDYGNSDSASYVEIVDRFQKDMARTFGGTTYAPRYVNTEVNYITHPKTVNSSWPDGLLVKFDVETSVSKNNEPIDQCEMWKQMMGSLQRTNGAIGGGSMKIASDSEQLNPCKIETPPEDMCGGQVCNEKLGEQCIAGSICGCPDGMKRASKDDVCRVVESWSVPILISRRKSHNIVYESKMGNPQTEIHKEMVQRFEHGVSQCYPHTELASAFVSSEVNDIVNPTTVNATWDSGVLFNATMHFRKGAVRIPSDVYYKLVRYIVDKNGYQLGDSELYLNPYQPDPYKACYKNDCHPSGKCIDLTPTTYRCECGAGFRDLDPSFPGRKCLPTNGFNECEKKEDNDCSENARCIDLPHLYKCECLPSYADASPPGAIPGSVCNLDYCSDVNFCPTNTTCKNMEQQAECKCDAGFMDIRKSEKRTMLGMDSDTLCMHVRDVDECALGLTNCSGVADCIDRPIGYTCKCPDGYIDGNPDEPGRVCGALLCDLCNSHGDCVHNAQTNNITCVCTDGWSGEFCQAAPSNASMVLMIILALLFLLLMLCCLLYFCTKCHCFKGRRMLGGAPFAYRNGAWPWSTLEGSSSSESGADFSQLSANGREYYPDIGIPRAKLVKGAESAAVNRSMDVARLDDYLDAATGLRIPRAHLAGGGHAAGGGAHDSFDSESSSGSEYTIKEEVERRVVTDVNVKEIKTTTTTDENGHTVTTTAEYHRTPEEFAGMKAQNLASSSSYAAGDSSSSHYAANASSAHSASSAHMANSSHLTSSAHATSAAMDSSSAAQMGSRSHAAGYQASSGAHGYSNQAMRMSDEQERGESVAEFSIGRTEGRRMSQNQLYSENREISEYTDEASMFSSDDESVENEKGDKKVKMSTSHSYEPNALGETERFHKEMVTTRTSTSTSRH